MLQVMLEVEAQANHQVEIQPAELELIQFLEI
jgi:hypothetical protein